MMTQLFRAKIDGPPEALDLIQRLFGRIWVESRGRTPPAQEWTARVFQNRITDTEVPLVVLSPCYVITRFEPKPRLKFRSVRTGVARVARARKVVICHTALIEHADGACLLLCGSSAGFLLQDGDQLIGR